MDSVQGPSPANPAPARTALSAEEVRKVARLAKLALTPAQVEQYRRELGTVLAYMDRLKELNLGDVEPMSHPTEATNRLAEDVPGPMLQTDVFMKMAPDVAEPFLKVPKVLGDAGSA